MRCPHCGNKLDHVINTNENDLIKQLEQQAWFDQLTGLRNRCRIIMDQHSIDIEENLPISVIVGDLDNLKQTNDKHGHHQGDALLYEVAKTLTQALPNEALIARMGGDEFLMLLPNTTMIEAEGYIKKIARTLKRSKLQSPPSISLGAATKVSADGSLQNAISKADEAMYIEKRCKKKLARG